MHQRLRRRRLLMAVVAAGTTLLAAGCASSSSPAHRGGQERSSDGRTSGSASPTSTIPAHQGAPGSWQVVVADPHENRPLLETETLTASGTTVVVARFDGPTTRLVLHPGSEEPGPTGWLTGPVITPSERPNVVGAFNGGFRLGLGQGGFLLGGRNFGAIQPGFASVVTYADGSSQIGTWGQGVPAPGKPVVSVRQNLHLLVDNRQPAADIDAYGPWGATLGGGFAVARSGLGIDQYGNLLWAGSSASTPRALAAALIQAGAVRAMELDINPMWVCAFGFPSPVGPPVPLLPTQSRPVGTYLTPYGRDFFTVELRGATQPTPSPSGSSSSAPSSSSRHGTTPSSRP